MKIIGSNISIILNKKKITDTTLKCIIEDDLWKELIPNNDIRDKFQSLWIIQIGFLQN